MAWCDNPAEYYRNFSPDDAVGQGDIIIAPTSLIVPGIAEGGMAGPADIGETRRSLVWRSVSDEFPAAPDLSADVRWGLAMVVPHACAMEKEWNDRVKELLAGGVDKAEAIQQANADANLDEYITLAPIELYASIAEWKHDGIKKGQRLEYFPVCGSDVIPEGFVNFNQLSTVHYTLVKRSLRQAVLSDLALAHLHHGMTMHFASRGLAGLEDLEKAVGETIVRVAVSPRAKGKLVVDFILSSGKSVTVESKDTGAQPDAPERPARG
jgi:hypothetical protein